MTRAVFRQPSVPLAGVVTVPPDKSISHRAVLFAAMSEGTSHLHDVLDSADVRATIGAVRALGADVRVTRESAGSIDCAVRGWGELGPTSPASPIDCGNSGTTARMLMGVLAGWPVRATLSGDASLSTRPMGRVMRPLELMGARFDAREGSFLPVEVYGGELAAIDYALPVASAQVKSAILLAGLRAAGRTAITEPAPSRDHTERLLPAFGAPVSVDGTRVALDGPAPLVACDVRVPADPSSAAFMVAAALMITKSQVALPSVCINPTRAGFLRVLDRMGADVSATDVHRVGAEPVATLVARHTPRLVGATVLAEEVPALIDEIPMLALVATRAVGMTRFEGVSELRVKEADRLAATVEALRAFGAEARAGDDWLEVVGPTVLSGANVDSLGDHRLAMAWAVAGLAATGETKVDRFEAVDVSYPGFLSDLTALGVTPSAE